MIQASRRAIVLLLVLSYTGLAGAWGDQGHRIVAAIAYSRLTTEARVTVDALLAQDGDKTTAPDFISRATWADKVLDGGKMAQMLKYDATREWHFVEIEITADSVEAALERACHNFRRLREGTLASRGTPRDCILNKVEQFAAELDNMIEAEEKILALKFLVHLVGDLHQPLHVAQDFDLFGENTALRFPSGTKRKATDLHKYWDTDVVAMLMTRPAESDQAIAERLLSNLTPEEVEKWSVGTPGDWIVETVEVARNVVYDVPKKSREWNLRGATFFIDEDYEARARLAVKTQLTKAGLRLARLLNEIAGR